MIVIIDGMNLFLRYYFANSHEVNGENIPCSGITGFLNFIQWFSNKNPITEIIVIWEQGGSNKRRKKIFHEYKNGRSGLAAFDEINNAYDNIDEKRDEFLKLIRESKAKNNENIISWQILTLISLLQYLPIRQIFIKDSECDDIVAYLVFKLKEKKEKIAIVSSDRDYYQLLDTEKNIVIFDPGKKTFIDCDYVKENYGVMPHNFLLVRSIVGDPSDDINGINGISVKTIIKYFPELISEKEFLIQEFIELCKKKLKTSQSEPEKRVLKLIIDNESIIRRNWKLMYLLDNLLSRQINKVENILNEKLEPANKFGLMKETVKVKLNHKINYDFLIKNLNMIFYRKNNKN